MGIVVAAALVVIGLAAYARGPEYLRRRERLAGHKGRHRPDGRRMSVATARRAEPAGRAGRELARL